MTAAVVRSNMRRKSGSGGGRAAMLKSARAVRSPDEKKRADGEVGALFSVVTVWRAQLFASGVGAGAAGASAAAAAAGAAASAAGAALTFLTFAVFRFFDFL